MAGSSSIRLEDRWLVRMGLWHLVFPGINVVVQKAGMPISLQADSLRPRANSTSFYLRGFQGFPACASFDTVNTVILQQVKSPTDLKCTLD